MFPLTRATHFGTAFLSHTQMEVGVKTTGPPLVRFFAPSFLRGQSAELLAPLEARRGFLGFWSDVGLALDIMPLFFSFFSFFFFFFFFFFGV